MKENKAQQIRNNTFLVNIYLYLCSGGLKMKIQEIIAYTLIQWNPNFWLEININHIHIGKTIRMFLIS